MRAVGRDKVGRGRTTQGGAKCMDWYRSAGGRHFSSLAWGCYLGSFPVQNGPMEGHPSTPPRRVSSGERKHCLKFCWAFCSYVPLNYFLQ